MDNLSEASRKDTDDITESQFDQDKDKSIYLLLARSMHGEDVTVYDTITDDMDNSTSNLNIQHQVFIHSLAMKILIWLLPKDYL